MECGELGFVLWGVGVACYVFDGVDSGGCCSCSDYPRSVVRGI